MYIDRWDKYEKEKEELTIDKIILDLKDYYRQHIWYLIAIPLGFPLIYIVLKCAILCFFNGYPGKDFETIFNSFFIILTLLYIIETLWTIIFGFYLIRKKDIYIYTDVVVNKKNKRYNTKYTSARPYILEFEKSTPLKILDQKYYKWSLFYPSTDDEIYERTSLNDEFYLINLGKRKCVIGYNKKHFELKE